MFTLEQHAERANAIVWADADEAAMDAWCEEGLAAETEGHPKAVVARAFGVARKTYTDRQSAYQSRRSGADADGARVREKRRRNQRSEARTALKDPQSVRELLADPEVRRSVEEALDATPLAPASTTSRGKVEAQAPGEMLLMEFHAWYIRGKRLIALAQESGRLNKAGREDLEGTAERVRALTDLIVTAATSGDWDDELEALLEEGAA